MIVNTALVKALMSLRNLTIGDLTKIATVTSQELTIWLDDDQDGSEDALDFETQLDILKFLGISGELPRSDIVHYWKVTEPFFGKPQYIYWALLLIAKAFGPAKVAYIAAQEDNAIELKPVSRFAIKFPTFMAMLEITVHPWRSLKFNPDVMDGLEWVPDCNSILLPREQFDKIEPGSLRVNGLHQYLTYSSEVKQWESLRELALTKGVKADQVAKALLGQSLLEDLRTDADKATTKQVAPKSNLPQHVEPTDDELFSKPISVKR